MSFEEEKEKQSYAAHMKDFIPLNKKKVFISLPYVYTQAGFAFFGRTRARSI
jgi:hypothetical protein